MMKNISVYLFINILFILVLTLLIGAFFAFVSLDKERQKNAQIARYKLISNALLSTASLNPSHEKMEKFYKNSRVKPVTIDANRLLIISKGENIFEGESVYGRMQIFKVGDSNYIYLQRYGKNMMLKDMDTKEVRINLTIFIATLIALLFLFFYIVTMRKLAPLKKLNREILEFASGNMDVKITYKSRDEIGQIGQSFDDAIHHIKKLLDSKNLFMRNMMHELKTPITKGRIAVEMVEEGLSKRTLILAFDRMNELINELAHVEDITTQGFQKELQEVSMRYVVEESIERLLCNRNQLIIEIEDDTLLITDEKLLALALKNLIDNALKYGENEKVKIVINKQSIKVISKGKSLEYPLAYYLEPFTQEEKRQSGFGLGLYIVDNIAKRLGYTLHYYYKESSNVFELQL